MTWRGIPIHCLLAVLIGVVPTFAENDATRAKCIETRTDPDQTITSCTPIIDDVAKQAAEKFTAYVRRARAHFSKQDWDQAIADFNSAIQLLPDVAEAYNERGAAYGRKGDGERAISDYSTAIRLAPGTLLAYGNRGLAYLKIGAYDLAIADFDEAIRLDPTYSVAYNGRGVAYSNKGDHRKAIPDFNEAIRLNGFYANAYNNRGRAHADMGNFDQAVADLKVAVQLEDNPNFYNELAWTYFRAGQAMVGLPYANRALGLNPSYAKAYDTRGSIHEALGDNVKAIADFKRALAFNSSLANSVAALARLAQTDPASVTFSNVVQFVEQYGWRINLGDMCDKLELARNGDDCTFQQLSVQEVEGRSDPRGFNVPAASNSLPPYVLIFHSSPLVGEFFVVSPDGTLMRAFVRFKGTDYSRIPNEDVREEFKKDIAYWTTNFTRLKQGLEATRSGQK